MNYEYVNLPDKKTLKKIIYIQAHQSLLGLAVNIVSNNLNETPLRSP